MTCRGCVRNIVGCIVASTLLSFAQKRACALDAFWSNSRGDGSGTFSLATNWSPSVPGASDVAHFGRTTSSLSPKAYTVTFTTDPTNLRLVVEDDAVAFNLNDHFYQTTSPIAVMLGTESGRAGQLTVTDGPFATPLEADINIGQVAGSAGVLNVTTGGLVLGSPEVFVGLNSAGTLNINNGGDLIADDTKIGVNSNGTGTATITGASSSLLAAQLVVGSGGTGALNVTASGRVESANGILGDAVGSSGAVTVSGANAQWLSSSLTVGDFGEGTMTITDGARVQSVNGSVAFQNSATGSVTVDGVNSLWTNSGDLQVGEVGDGTLNISSGGRVQSGPLIVGRKGEGKINITAGGLFETAGVIIGEEGIGTGVVTVSGANSQWTSPGQLRVGHFGDGTIEITGGGRVQSGGGSIAFLADSTSTVSVDGANSIWTNSGSLQVGEVGVGDLSISAGGRVIASDLIVGRKGEGTINIFARSRLETNTGLVSDEGIGTGVVNVSGPGAEWTNTNSLRVGNFGNGTMSITGGGHVQNANGSVAFQNSATGVITVDGVDSLWMNTGELQLGEVGDGALNISDGGRVQSGTLIVGRKGEGTINIITGGRLETGSSVLAEEGIGTGVVIVSGADSAWTIGGPLFVGGSETGSGGSGTLRIQSGGTVQVAQHTIVFAGDLLQLGGGTFSSTDISFQGGGSFAWTSGTLHAGIFRGSLVVPSGGILAPGNSVGSTEVRVDYSQQVGGILQIEIGGPAPTQFDRVTVTGDAFLGGNLQLALSDGFLPTSSSMLTIFDARSISGAFANVVSGQRLTTSDGQGSFLVNYGSGSPFDPSQIVLSNFALNINGDFDHDGDVDGNDFLAWQRGGSPVPLSSADLAAWRGNFGTAGLTARGTAVPEPRAEWLALALTSFALLFQERRWLRLARDRSPLTKECFSCAVLHACSRPCSSSAVSPPCPPKKHRLTLSAPGPSSSTAPWITVRTIRLWRLPTRCAGRSTTTRELS